jgi:hypothetical protein
MLVTILMFLKLAEAIPVAPHDPSLMAKTSWCARSALSCAALQNRLGGAQSRAKTFSGGCFL